jgi:hypothetical protein
MGPFDCISYISRRCWKIMSTIGNQEHISVHAGCARHIRESDANVARTPLVTFRVEKPISQTKGVLNGEVLLTSILKPHGRSEH